MRRQGRVLKVGEEGGWELVGWQSWQAAPLGVGRGVAGLEGPGAHSAGPSLSFTSALGAAGLSRERGDPCLGSLYKAFTRRPAVGPPTATSWEPMGGRNLLPAPGLLLWERGEPWSAAPAPACPHRGARRSGVMEELG